MVNPFYVDPSLDITAGLKGLQGGLAYRQERKDKEKALDAKKKASQIALTAYQTNDPDKIAEAILMNPEIGETLGELYDKSRGYAKEDYAISLEKLITELETTGTLVPSTPIISAAPAPSLGLGLPIVSGKKPTSKIDVIRSIYAKDPKAGKQMIEYEFAKADPKKYKAWKDVYGQKAKGLAPSSIKRKFDEYQKLKEQNDPKNEKLIKKYEEDLFGEHKEEKDDPTSLKSHFKELDALRTDKTLDPIEKAKRIKAYENKIYKKKLDKEFAPSKWKKMYEEKLDYIADGMSLDHPLIEAFDREMSGIDIDLSSLTPEKIDALGYTYFITGIMPSVGRGKSATAIRVKILESAARYMLEAALKEAGLDKSDLKNADPKRGAMLSIAARADTKSIQGALNFLEKQKSSMGSFVQNMEEQITQIKALGEDLFTFDTRLLNTPLRFLRGRIVGSPLQARYDLYLAEIEREIAKLASNATSSIAAMSVEEVKAWAKIHDKSLSVSDMAQLLDTTLQATKIRMESVDDQLNLTRERMRTREYKPGGTVDLPTISTQEEYNALESGDKYIDSETGKPGRKP